MELPTYDELKQKLKENTELNPLEFFIFEDEPYRNDGYWRTILKNAIEFSIEESKGQNHD